MRGGREGDPSAKKKKILGRKSSSSRPNATLASIGVSKMVNRPTSRFDAVEQYCARVPDPAPKRHQESNEGGWGGNAIAVERVEKKPKRERPEQ